MKKLMLLFLALMLSGCSGVREVKSYELNVRPQKLQFSTARFMVNQMDLEEKIYQSMILGFDGTYLTGQLDGLLKDGLGGVILFSRNISSADQVSALNTSILAANHLKPFVAVDQEGGRVNRFPREYRNTASAFALASTGDANYVMQEGIYTGSALKAMHYNVDFSTVLDIWTNPQNTVIGDRSFGTTPEAVIKYAGAFNRGIQQAGIATAAKHFPGHGDTSVDSHAGLPFDNAALQELERIELKPFAALQREVDMIMVSHIVFTALDDAPASLSYPVITGLLKDKLGYEGVIITDDLAMGAITQYYTREEAAIQALKAGNTMLLMGSNYGDIPALVSRIKAEVESGNIKETLLDENIEKIIRLKLKYGIL